MRLSPQPPLRLGTFLVVAAVLLLGCGDGDGDAAPVADPTTTTSTTTTSTTVPETTTTTAAPSPEEEVLAAYANYWQAVDAAFDPPQVEPEHPALREYATGEALAGITANARETLSQNRARRIRSGGRYAHRAEVLTIDGDTATVRDCTIDDTVIVNTVDGAVIDDGVSTRLYISMLVHEAGQWKLALQNREKGWEGVDGCALETR